MQELANADLKDQGGQGRSSRSRQSGYSRHHSPSPSRVRENRSKDSFKPTSGDLLKSTQQQLMPTPEQMMAMNAPLQQVLQDAMKAGQPGVLVRQSYQRCVFSQAFLTTVTSVINQSK